MKWWGGTSSGGNMAGEIRGELQETVTVMVALNMSIDEATPPPFASNFGEVFAER